MTRRSWIQFFLLAAMWGASYLFIKVALEDVSPPMVVFARTALAALVLLPFALRADALSGLRESGAAFFMLALLQVAAPFMLISVGQQEISTSLAGILVATAPIYTFLLAFRFERENRPRGIGLLGVLLGVVGVGMLLGGDLDGGSRALLGGLLVVVATLGYALGAFYLRHRFAGTKPIGTVTATMAASALMTLPFALATFPTGVPDLETFGSLGALGVFGTGISFVLFYTLIADIGPSKTSLVAYVAPGFAVIYGVTLLGEDFTATTLAGLVLILGGSYLAAEARSAPPPAAEPDVSEPAEQCVMPDVPLAPAARR